MEYYFLIIQLQSELRHGGLVGVTDWINQHGLLSCYWNSEVWNLDRVNWLGGGGRIESSPILIPLWYVRDLMVCCIVSPLFYWLLSKTRVFGLLLLSFGYITGLGLGLWGFNCHSYMFYGLGAFCKIKMIDATKITYRWRYALYGLAIVLWLIETMYNGHNTRIGDYIYPFWILVGCMAFFNLAVTICRHHKVVLPSLLIRSSFFIYVVHTIYFVTFSNHITDFIFGTTNPLFMSFGFLLSPIITTSLCVLFYLVLSKLMPKTMTVLTGER